MRNKFENAREAFLYFYNYIHDFGVDFNNTKALFNVGFEIDKPIERDIDVVWRKFNLEYAEAEWDWYLSGDPNVDKLGEIYGMVPQVWKGMVDWKNEVRSNYGWQWLRNDQLFKVIQQLKENPDTRQAAISIYDGKEIDSYRNDTPCTYAVQFTRLNGKLNMAVCMRSNDLWFGFCNDQYCFSKLQSLVADAVGIPVGTYYHFAHNLHLYNNFLNRHK